MLTTTRSLPWPQGKSVERPRRAKGGTASTAGSDSGRARELFECCRRDRIEEPTGCTSQASLFTGTGALVERPARCRALLSGPSSSLYRLQRFTLRYALLCSSLS